jgi:hypothetical protein
MAIDQFDTEKIEEIITPLVLDAERGQICHSPNSATRLIDLQS